MNGNSLQQMMKDFSLVGPSPQCAIIRGKKQNLKIFYLNVSRKSFIWNSRSMNGNSIPKLMKDFFSCFGKPRFSTLCGKNQNSIIKGLRRSFYLIKEVNEWKQSYEDDERLYSCFWKTAILNQQCVEKKIKIQLLRVSGQVFI